MSIPLRRGLQCCFIVAHALTFCITGIAIEVNSTHKLLGTTVDVLFPLGDDTFAVVTHDSELGVRRTFRVHTMTSEVRELATRKTYSRISLWGVQDSLLVASTVDMKTWQSSRQLDLITFEDKRTNEGQLGLSGPANRVLLAIQPTRDDIIGVFASPDDPSTIVAESVRTKEVLFRCSDIPGNVVFNRTTLSSKGTTVLLGGVEQTRNDFVLALGSSKILWRKRKPGIGQVAAQCFAGEKYIIAGSSRGRLEIVHRKDGQALATFEIGKSEIRQPVTFEHIVASKTDHAAGALGEDTIVLIDAKRGQIRTLQWKSAIGQIGITPDGSTILITHKGGSDHCVVTCLPWSKTWTE